MGTSSITASSATCATRSAALSTRGHRTFSASLWRGTSDSDHPMDEPMTADEVIQQVQTFMATELKIADARDLSRELPLLQRSVLDSIELLQLVSFLEK